MGPRIINDLGGYKALWVVCFPFPDFNGPLS